MIKLKRQNLILGGAILSIGAIAAMTQIDTWTKRLIWLFAYLAVTGYLLFMMIAWAFVSTTIKRWWWGGHNAQQQSKAQRPQARPRKATNRPAPHQK